MAEFSGQNVVVTGGAGFIGSHLTERLLKGGANVTVIDNCSTGRLENLESFDDVDNLTIIEADISCDQISPYFEGQQWVFHLAALADIVPSIQMPTEYFQANVVGTQRVLEAARAHGVARFLYAASSSCYGIPDTYPTPETAKIQPQYPYALTKYLGEELVLHWHQVYQLPAISLRLFNVYGPRSRTSGTYGAVFGVFLAQKLSAQPYTVVGDGTQTRDFTFVTDVVDAFITAAESDVTGEIMNVGSDNTYSVNRLVELLGGEITYIPKRPGEPECTYADITKIKDRLGWTPSVSFEDGVTEMISNIEYWRQAPVWNEDSIAEATKEWFELLK